MELKSVEAIVKVTTEGGSMEFTINGVGKNTSILGLGQYIARKVDDHIGAFSGLAEKQKEVDNLQVQLEVYAAEKAEAMQRERDAKKVAEMERLERLRKSNAKPSEPAPKA